MSVVIVVGYAAVVFGDVAVVVGNVVVDVGDVAFIVVADVFTAFIWVCGHLMESDVCKFPFGVFFRLDGYNASTGSRIVRFRVMFQASLGLARTMISAHLLVQCRVSFQQELTTAATITRGTGRPN